MKKLFLLAVLAGLCWATPRRVDAADATRLATESVPLITSIRLEGTNVVVVVSVPADIAKVTLEGCRRLGGEAWTPKAVGRLDGAGGGLTFRLAQSPDLEMLRVRADAREALPDFFYQGPTSFAGQPVNGGGIMGAGSAGVMAPGAGAVTPDAVALVNSGEQVQARAVVESDIWKISGDTLYLFNQYRG